MVRYRRVSWLCVLSAALLLLGACKGDTGEPGPEGPPGEQGPPGETPSPELELEPLGVVGRVSEPNLIPVPGGTVYLVPAGDVETLAETPIDIFLSPAETASLAVDEPIEDLIDTNGDGYEQAEVDVDGVYRFETLPEGSHFVVWMPAADDDQHLPGGSSSSAALDSEQLVGMQLDIRVSSQPGPSATYVGSSTCMVCHGLHSTKRTAHMVGLQVPGARSVLQDIEPWPDFDAGLDQFDAGTTLFYYDCADGGSNPSNCRVATSDPSPGGDVSLELRLGRDTDLPVGLIGAYYVDLVNRENAEAPQRYDVVLTYGGALGKQQYLTRRENGNGTLSYFLLPLQFNYEGDPSNDSSNDWPWRDYRSNHWFDFGNGLLTEPENAESFDNNCAGCHLTGYRLEGSDAAGWSARAIVDSDGAFDYDGDGRPELINVGCESCHGPGSDHLMPATNGRFMVSPGLLTPGRQAALCGSCHSRPLGIGGGQRGLPLSAENEMPPPGIRRADFALNHTTRVSGDEDEDFFASGDAFGHYQQYSDHLRSSHYRNGSRLTSCTNCHSPHANDAEIAAMDTSGNPNALCTTCHSPEANPELYPLRDHIAEVTGVTVHSDFGPFFCTDCHMVPTAKSGAALPELFDRGGSGELDVQYYWNDISSHRLTMTRWTEFSGQPDQPIAFTISCGGSCHGGVLPNPAP